MSINNLLTEALEAEEKAHDDYNYPSPTKGGLHVVPQNDVEISNKKWTEAKDNLTNVFKKMHNEMRQRLPPIQVIEFIENHRGIGRGSGYTIFRLD